MTDDLDPSLRPYIDKTLELVPELREFLEATLTAKQLYVWLTIEVDGFKPRTIAHAMNLDEATIRGHHKRATRRLANATRTKDEAA